MKRNERKKKKRKGKRKNERTKEGKKKRGAQGSARLSGEALSLHSYVLRARARAEPCITPLS